MVLYKSSILECSEGGLWWVLAYKLPLTSHAHRLVQRQNIAQGP